MKVIYINGEKACVTEEIYIAYKKGARKFRYFTEDLKRERILVNQEEEKVKFIPAREDSYERLTCDCDYQFPDETENTEEDFIRKINIRNVRNALATLNESEKQIIYGFFYEGKLGKEIASEMGVSEMSISKRKRNILKKLRKILEK